MALSGIAFANVSHPALASMAPAAYFATVLAALATATVLFLGPGLSAPQRSSFVLALAFTALGIFTLCVMVVSPLLNGAAPIWRISPQAGIWCYAFGHLTLGSGAIAYNVYRRHAVSEPISAAFSLRALGVAAVAIACGLIAALRFGDDLPHLVNGSSLAGLRSTGVGVAILILCAAAAAMTLRIPRRNEVDLALAMTLVAMTADIAFFLVSGERYTAGFYCGRFLQFAATTFVLASAVRALLGVTARLDEAQGALVRSEGETAKRESRIQALWRIAATDAIVDDRSRYQEVLRIATGAVRTGKPMFGALSHVDGAEIVVDATCWAGPREPVSTVGPGSRFPLEGSTQSMLLACGRTEARDDLRGDAAGRSAVWLPGWGSLIGSPLQIGHKAHFVLFASPETMLDQPFAEDDVAYVDLVASYLSNRFVQQQQVEKLQFQSRHDPLTGLDTRLQFRAALADAIERKAPFSVAIVDIDGFGQVNVVEGHETGDAVLVEIATALRGVDVRDVVARLSGDEFGILMRSATSNDALSTAVERYLEPFRTAFRIADRSGNRLLNVTASFGITLSPDGGVAADDLMRQAAVALDVAKTRGAATAMVFDAPMQAILAERTIRSLDLSAAIAEDQLALEYQPTFDLASRAIIGAEALVRWDHPTRGRLPPSEFIPFAERNGLIAPLSRWVFERVVRDVLSASLPTKFICYLNVAPQLLNDFAFIGAVNRTLRQHPGLASSLGFEITETAAMQNVERSMHTLSLFRSWGLRVAIDDFGTGYSSLSYLKRLAVDLIKIDKSFVTGLPEDDKDAALCEMLLRMAQRFGLATLAEGIETEAQAAWLLRNGCTSGQGFLVSRPVGFPALMSFVRDQLISV